MVGSFLPRHSNKWSWIVGTTYTTETRDIVNIFVGSKQNIQALLINHDYFINVVLLALRKWLW